MNNQGFCCAVCTISFRTAPFAPLRVSFIVHSSSPHILLLNLVIAQSLFLAWYLQLIAFNFGSGVCIDRQHLELRKVRHVDCKSVQDSQLGTVSAQNRISNPTIRRQKIDPQNGAVAKIDIAYELHEPRRGRDDIEAFMTDFRKAAPDSNFWAPRGPDRR